MAEGQQWALTVTEGAHHRLTVDGLPADREERQSLVWRLRDVLAMITHADDTDHEGDGVLWQRYARPAAAGPGGWLEESVVELVPGSR